MGYNKLFISLFFLIPIAFSTQDTELAYSCSVGNSGYYDRGSNYSKSLDYLVNDLYANAPNHNGFWNASKAEDPSNTAYGIALCRGDVSPKVCKTCLKNATNTLLKTYCTDNSMGAIILHDFCLFKYLDIDFRGEIDSELYFDSNSGYYVIDCTSLHEEAIRLLTNLSKTAIATPDKLFANGTKETGNATTLYGMVQCTTDLPVYNCSKCLNDAINGILNWCTNKTGVQVVYGSCSIRYETYPFLY